MKFQETTSIKRVVIKGVPDRSTRLAMLKTGEADIGYLMVGVEAQTIKSDPKLRLAHVIPSATWWVEFPEQWKPQSPWHDRRVRLAANLAIDRQGINEAERIGLSRLTGSIIPSVMEFALRIEPYPYDPAQAKRLLAAAGYPSGFDAGDITPLPPFTTVGEAMGNYLAAVGISHTGAYHGAGDVPRVLAVEETRGPHRECLGGSHLRGRLLREGFNRGARTPRRAGRPRPLNRLAEPARSSELSSDRGLAARAALGALIRRRTAWS